MSKVRDITVSLYASYEYKMYCISTMCLKAVTLSRQDRIQ